VPQPVPGERPERPVLITHPGILDNRDGDAERVKVDGRARPAMTGPTTRWAAG
jgi:hypothetical protein